MLEETKFTHPRGLTLIRNFVTPSSQKELFEFFISELVTEQQKLKRRVKHYGHRFEYESLYIDARKGFLPVIPSQCSPYVDEFVNKYKNIIGWDYPDQLTVNEYLPGQGIGFHVDTHSAFRESIVIISLGSRVNMTFRKKGEITREVALEPGSLAILTGEARFAWSHGIMARKTDPPECFRRGTRISLTFRKLNFDSGFSCSCAYPEFCDTQNPLSLRLPDRIKSSSTTQEL